MSRSSLRVPALQRTGLLGFLGIYSVLSILWIVLVYRFIRTGPGIATPVASSLTA